MGSSASGVAGLLHPAADPGVRYVSVLCIPSKTGCCSTFPQRRTYPSKKSLAKAVPRHRGRCLLAVLFRSPPSLARFRCRFQVCQGGRVGSVGFEALLRRQVWLPPRHCCLESTAPSWALFLFKVPPHDRGFRAPIVAFAIPTRGWFITNKLRCALHHGPGPKPRVGEHRDPPKRTVVETAPVGPVSGSLRSRRSEDRCCRGRARRRQTEVCLERGGRRRISRS